MLASKIIGVGSYVPPKVMKNQDLEKMMDTSDEWIQQRTGIKQRHWCEAKDSTSDLGVEASLKAIEAAGINKDDIDLIIFATLSPDHDFPGSGCFLQAKLGLKNVPALDIRQQCSGFIYGMSVADKFIRSGSHKNVLLVGAEIHSKGLDRTPEGRGVSVLFGDGAGAVVISATEVKDSKNDPHILTTHIYADGNHAKELWLPGPGTGLNNTDRFEQSMVDEKAIYPYMNGKVVFVHAVKRMSEALTTALKTADVKLEDIDCFLFHQANIRINDKVGEMLGINPDKVFNTIQDFGNTTAATIPLGMDHAIKAGKLKPGMLVASAAFGSGFTWGAAIYRI